MALAVVAALLMGIASGWTAPADRAQAVSDALRISEVMTLNGASLSPDGDARPDWVEIENTTDEAVPLSDYALMTQSKPTAAFVFTGGEVVPHGRVIVCCDGVTEPLGDGIRHAPFRLPAAGVTLLLLNRHGQTADIVTTPALDRDQAWCRDADGEWTLSDHPTPGTSNRVGPTASDGQDAAQAEIARGPIELTEVMGRNATYFADEDGEYPDCIEIHNATAEPMSLAGWALSDSGSDLKKWHFPAITLPADGWLAVHCSGKDRAEDPAHLHTNFRLNGDGEDVFLTAPEGTVADRVTLPALEADIAWSRTESGWTSALPASPGYPNDQSGFDAAADAIARANPAGVYITELLATSNKSEDWIELYNAGAEPVDLSGYGLSDRSAKPRKWQFPEGTVIEPGAYLGVFADGNTQAEGAEPHTSFRLNADGGYAVTLSDPQGHIIDRVFVRPQYLNISYGRPESLKGVRYFEAPTPGTANGGEMWYARAPQPEFSTEGGLYRTGDVITVTLSAPSDCQVYYTLDCTDPTPDSPLYTAPITIDGTTILRARAYREGCMPSWMDARSFLFDVNNGDGTVVVSSLVSDPYNLTSEEYGIMAMGPNALKEYPYGSRGKGANFWMDWEREAHIEVFAPDGSTLLSQECSTKLHGNSGRARDQKAFKVLARNRYGSNRFPAALFTRRPYTEYQSFVLRAGSQDGSRTRMRDAMLQQLAAGTSVMYQEYEIGVLYLNGQYWGHYNLRENINPHSICQFEGWEGEADAIDFVKRNRTVVQGSNETMETLLDWIKSHDSEMDSDAAYDVIDAAIDIQNYLEYMSLEIFVGNTDAANIKRYRNANRDGKWRWILYDLDMAFREDTNSVRRWLKPGGMGGAKNTDNTLFIGCIKNSRIRERFLEIFGRMLAQNCTTDNVSALTERFYNAMQPIMPDQFERWGQDAGQYQAEVQKLLNYAKKRPARLLQFVKGCAELHVTREEMEQYFGAAMSLMGVTYDDIEAY